MARNTQEQNPTRVAIATVEDQNKYQIARNRNLDQPNQVFDTNVAADVKPYVKSDLVRLAEALSESSPYLEKYVNSKIEEQNNLDSELGKKDAIENPNITLTDAQKAIADKSKAYAKSYMAVHGFNAKVADITELQGKWDNLPEKEKLNTNVTTWIGEQMKEKNKGITDPYFLAAYNHGVPEAIGEMQKKSLIKKFDDIKQDNVNQVRDFIVNNPSIVNDFGSVEAFKNKITSERPLSKKEVDDIIFSVAESKQSSGKVEDLRFLENLKNIVNSNPKSSDGVPVFGKYANTGIMDKMVLNAVKSIAERKNLEENLKDQEFKEKYNVKINEAFLMAREGKTKEALANLDKIMKSNLDVLELKEVKTYYNIIEGAYNEVLAEKKQYRNLLKPDSASGSGGGGSGNSNYIALMMAASKGDITTAQIEQLRKEGRLGLNAKDTLRVYDRARAFERDGNVNVDLEDEGGKPSEVVIPKKIAKEADEITRKSLLIPKPQFSSMGYSAETQSLLKGAYVAEEKRITDAVAAGVKSGKIKNESDVHEYVAPLIEQANKRISKMPSINTRFNSVQEYLADVQQKKAKGIKINPEVINLNIEYYKQREDKLKNK